MFHQLLRAAVHRNVRDGHHVFHGTDYPVVIGADDELRFTVKQPVIGRHEGQLQLPDAFQVFRDDFPEGHHDFRVVPFSRVIYPGIVSGINVTGSDVIAQEIAGKKHLLFQQVREHGL